MTRPISAQPSSPTTPSSSPDALAPAAPTPSAPAPAPTPPTSRAPATPGAPQLTPPSVAQSVEATYPEAAREAGLEATVELVVTIAADGSVTDVSVPTPVGSGFDEAAIEAVRRFRFEPARRDGVPIPSRIRYRYVFELPEDKPPEEALAPPTTGRLVGQVVADNDSSPVEGADVTILDLGTNEQRHVVADPEGRFALDDLAPGRYRLTVVGLGLRTVSSEEEVIAGQETSVTYRLASTDTSEEDQGPSYSARAAIDPPSREMTRRTIEREELYRIPGTRADPIRTIEILPGVARPPFGLGFIIVRGSAPVDTGIFIDGVPVPLIYHFGGLTSVYNGRLLERLNYFPSNFSTRYGRQMGGIVEVESRDPKNDRFHGIAEINPIDAYLLLEGPLTRRFALSGSFRRSLIDTWLPAVTPNSASLTAAPVYYDYQLIGTWRPTDRDRLRFQFYGSDDHFSLISTPSSEANISAAQNAVGLKTRFQNLQATWWRQLGGNTDQNVLIAVGPQHFQFSAPGFDAHFALQVTQIYARSQWISRLSNNFRLVSGIDIDSAPYNVTYTGNPPTASEGAVQNFTTLIGVHTKSFAIRPGVYGDLAFERGKVLFNSALRLDYYSDIRNYSLDPRFVFKYSIQPNLRIKAAAGIFSQPPQFQESNPDIGNPHLRPQHAAQFATGAEWEFRPGLTVGIEGFYKQLWSRVLQASTTTAPEPFFNGGLGRIYGLELSGTFRDPGGKFFGFFSYTLLSSRRQDGSQQPWRRFDFDQTNILNMSFTYRLPHNWEVGATFRYATGNPYTPVAGRVWDSTSRSYLPIYGVTNSARNPNFNRLDLRVQKTWQFQAWKLVLYLDVQNVYNHRLQEALLYNYDFTITQPILGLPIIPALGVRGEF